MISDPFSLQAVSMLAIREFLREMNDVPAQEQNDSRSEMVVMRLFKHGMSLNQRLLNQRLRQATPAMSSESSTPFEGAS